MALNNLKGLSELAKAASKSNKGKVFTVPVDDVVSKVQVRKRFRNIEELAATLLTEGQQSPIIVSPKNEKGQFVIQKGERRWRACKYAGIKTIDLIVNDKIQDYLDETAGELIENIQRDDLTPVEIAEALNKFIEKGWKQKDIAERLGKNITFVSTHLSLLKLSDCVRALYDNEVCSDTETLNNLRLFFDLNEERCRAVCAVAMSDGITRKQSRELLNDAKRIKKEMEQRHQIDTIQTDKFSASHSKDQTKNADGDSPPTQNTGQRAVEKDSELGRLNEERFSDEENKEWKKIRAENLIFTVKVNLDGETKRGVIMTNRVALIPFTVWIKTVDREGKEKHVQVPVSEIELLSVEG